MCNGCGVCEKICPAAAVKIIEKRPVFSGKCEHCVACIDVCPLRAIQFWRAKFNTRGYYHPGVSIKELIR
jgi:ferredoxin